MADGSAITMEAASVSRVPISERDKRIGVQAAYRPTLRTPAMIDEICSGLREGITLRQICSRKHLPNRQTILNWRDSDPELARQLADARARGCDALAEECIEIADNASNDYLERETSEGRLDKTLNAEHVQRSRLRIDTRLKIAAVWNRAEYGEKRDVNVSGSLTLEALVLSAIGLAEPAKSEPLNITPPAIEHAPSDIDDLL